MNEKDKRIYERIKGLMNKEKEPFSELFNGKRLSSEEQYSLTVRYEDLTGVIEKAHQAKTLDDWLQTNKASMDCPYIVILAAKEKRTALIQEVDKFLDKLVERGKYDE